MLQSSTSLADDPRASSHGSWQFHNAHINVRASGQPSATVRTSNNLPQRSKKAEIQEFAFVNSTAPGRNRDPEIRKLVRGHVVRDSTRRKKLQRGQQISYPENLRSSHSNAARDETFDSAGPISLSPKQAAFAISRNYLSAADFPTQGMDPHPQLSVYLYRISALGEAMYPQVTSFRFNPISPAAWFDCALKDEAVFHALLYMTCTYAGLITGSGENQEAFEHVGKTVSIVKQRIGDMIPTGRKPDWEYLENTVRTVSCLAITEAIKGNSDGWKMHMAGLKQLVVLRGGLANFETTIQLKLHRADLLGAVDYLQEPFLDKENSLPDTPSRYSDLGDGEQGENLSLLLNTLPISDELHDTLRYLQSLSHVVSGILGSSMICSGAQQVSWQKHAYVLRYSLLRGLGKCDSQDEERRILDEVLRIGALLYIQITPQEFPYSAVGPTKLTARLRKLVLTIQMWNEREVSLVMWLLFMGGISARKGGDKMWFVAQLEKLTTRLRLDWEVVRERLENLWWVKAIHEKPCKALWEQALELRTALDIYSDSSLFSM